MDDEYTCNNLTKRPLLLLGDYSIYDKKFVIYTKNGIKTYDITKSSLLEHIPTKNEI